MAYGKKYILSFVSDRGNDYRVEVLQQGYTDAAVNKSFGAAPVLNIEDGDGRVKGSSLAFSIQADTEGELSGLYTTNNKEYKVLLYRNNSLYWQGYLLPELYAENYVDPPYDVEVTATDQLATLKDVPYQGEDVQTSLLDIIKGILLQTQLDIPCKIHMQLTTAQGALLSTSYISAAAYNGQSCYDVLNAILLSCNCSIMQMANEWVIASLTDATTSYTTDAGVVNVPHCTIGQMGTADVCPEGSLIMVNAPALKGATVEYNHSLRNSMLINANCVNRDGWRYVPGGVQDRFPGEIDMGDAIYKCYFWLLKQKNLQQDNALQIWQDVELAHDVDNAYTLSFKYMFMSEADSLLLSVAYGTGDGTTLYLTTSGWKTGLDRYNINSYIQITGKNGNYGSVRELADTSKYESTTVKFMLPDKPGALRIGFINCTSDYSDPFFTRDILVTDVYLTVDNVTGKTSTTLVEPNATSAQEEVAIVYGEPIVTVNADKLDMSYLRYKTGAAVESVYLSGREYSSYYLAMVQEFARYYGVKKMQLQGALMGADVLHLLYADVHSGKIMRLTNAQYNLLEDSVSVSLEQVPSAFVDYELVVYAKENTSEKNTTTSAGVAVGGGGGESYLGLQGDGDVYVKQERSIVGKEARFDNVALPVAAPVRTADNTYIYSSNPAAVPVVDVVALVASIAGLESHFDGDVAKEAAKVSHAITFEGGAFSADSYNGSAAKTVKIPTTTEHIIESGNNLFHTASRARAAITGAASSIVSSNLTENRALISNASGKVAVSAVTSTELGYLSGVTSKVQDQLKSITDRIDILEALGLSLVTKDGKTYVQSAYNFYSKGGLTSGGIGSGGGGGTGGGSNVSYKGEYTSGILLGKVTIDGVAGNIYAPSALSAYTNDVGYITASAIPNYLPNPYALTINGTPYDGSAPVNITISGGSGGSFNGGIITGETTISTSSYGKQLSINRTDAKGAVAIRYSNSLDGLLGHIGIGGSETEFGKVPFFQNSDGTAYKLIHEGNYSSYALPKSGGTITNNLTVAGYLTVGSTTNTTVIKSFVDGTTNYTTIGGSAKPLIINNDTGDISLWKGTNDRQLTLSTSGSIIVKGANGGWACGMEYRLWNGTNVGSAAGALGGSTTFDYFYYGGGYQSAAMYIKQNGNVLIGKTNDEGQKLQVKGTVRASNWFYSDENTGWYSVKYAGGIYMKDTTYVTAYNGKAFMIERGNGDLDSFYTAYRTDTGYKMGFGIGSGGVNRGIYDYKLSRWAFYIDGSGNNTISGNLYTTGGMTSGKASDRRLKQNIMNLQRTNAVNVLRSLRPVVFEWNATAYSLDQRNNGADVGFIADEYEGLIPNSGRAIWEKYRAIEYDKCIPHLVLGWQIHESRFETVEDRLAKAEGRIKELEEELEQYKTAA